MAEAQPIISAKLRYLLETEQIGDLLHARGRSEHLLRPKDALLVQPTLRTAAHDEFEMPIELPQRDAELAREGMRIESAFDGQRTKSQRVNPAGRRDGRARPT
jgi:hypothetical protein